MERRYLVLLVEDEPVIQMLIADVLDGIGVNVSNAVTTAAEALRLVEHGDFDGAILDCELNDGRCDPVAEALAGRRIPYLIVSGLPAAEIAERFPDVRHVGKPFLALELEVAVRSMLGHDRRSSLNDNELPDLSQTV